MGDKPDLSDTEAAFYQYIGICISEWANVETQLFRLCAFVLKGQHNMSPLCFAALLPSKPG
jgi:hypothetical protein